MAIPSFFKQGKPRGFNYSPRYYDADKEERERRREELTGHRLEELLREKGETGKPHRTMITRGTLRGQTRGRVAEARSKSNKRLIIILIILALILLIFSRL